MKHCAGLHCLQDLRTFAFGQQEPNQPARRPVFLAPGRSASPVMGILSLLPANHSEKLLVLLRSVIAGRCPHPELLPLVVLG